MIDVEALINKYYSDAGPLRDILWQHSERVAERCLRIAEKHPELNLDVTFLYEAAMLHDIGIVRTNAPGIQCFGDMPYISHGYLGAELLRQEGLPRHARVCERHTGAGLSVKDVEVQCLPIPLQDYLPETMEEQVICYADKFYSKSHLEAEKSVDAALRSLSRFGNDGVERFRLWVEIFE